MKREDIDNMVRVCKRYEGIAQELGIEVGRRIDRLIDLEKAHDQCPIDFGSLLAGPDTDFVHDVAGIHANMNRATGTLENCFVPRFAA